MHASVPGRGLLGAFIQKGGLWPLFQGPLALIIGKITLMILYLDFLATVHSFDYAT